MVRLWKELVEGGCRLPRVKGRLPLALRLLRNTPYAAKGHQFKTKMLGDFYSRQSSGSCAWYQPHARKVVLPERELQCAQKLEKLETKIRRKFPIPEPMEAFLLDGGGGLLVQEIKRILRGKKARSKLKIFGSKKGGWCLDFDDFTGMAEGWAQVCCDAKGEGCRMNLVN